jgi:hypothetical protein
MKGFSMNIKNVICALSLVSFGLVGCTHAASTNVPVAPQPTAEVAPVPPPVDETPATPEVDTTAPVTVAGGAWSFVLPDGTWEHRNNDELAQVVNADSTVKVIFMAQPWEKTPGSFPMTAIHGFQKAGATVKSYNNVTINGVKYVHVVLARDENVDVTMWLGVKNKVAYGLMCGGLKSDSLTKTCEGIASTLKIN